MFPKPENLVDVPASRYARVMSSTWRGLAWGLGLSLFLASQAASAAVYSYVDWTEANVAEGTASGTITLPDDSTVSVTFAAINESDTPGTLYGAQISGGTSYWSPDAPFVSPEVENAPPSPDILQLQGGLNQVYEVTLSEPIKDPIMAIVSLGQPGVLTTYDFDAPFTIVSQGVGYWGGGATALQALEGDVLQGAEGHGTIQFLGTFATFSWTVPSPEGWHGFTFGIRTPEKLEPTPSGDGGAGGESASGGSGDGNAAGVTNAAGDSSVFGGNATDAGAAGEATGTAGGSPGGPIGGEGGSNATAAGAGGDERAQATDDAGCNCAVSRGSLGLPACAAALLLLVGVVRRARRTR